MFSNFCKINDKINGFIRFILYHCINNLNNCKQLSIDKEFRSRYKLKKSIMSLSDKFPFGNFISFDARTWTSSPTSAKPSICTESILKKEKEKLVDNSK